MKPAVGSERGRPDATTYECAQAAAARCDWAECFALLTAAHARGELDPRGLELLAASARWVARDDAIFEPLERAHALYTQLRDGPGAARTALELIRVNLDHARDAVAATWLARAEELLADLPNGPEHARLAWHRSRAAGARGATQEQSDQAQMALEGALRHRNRDIESLALVEIGHIAALQGRYEDAFAAVERATAIAVSGEAELEAAGLVLCNAIWLFRSCGEWDRAHLWTDTATRWVDRQQIEYFPALCRVHRSEVLRLRGRLADAERECMLAAALLQRSIPRYAVIAFAELGEVRRRRGDLAGAMESFERARQLGWDPQPGLALTLLARGETTAAFKAIERVFVGPQPTIQCEDRSSLLLARAAIALAADQPKAAQAATAELEQLASDNPSPWLVGACAEARGRVALHERRANDAVDALTRARRAWSELDAPFELATSASVLAAALEADGDAAGARLELATAEAIFLRIGAAHAAAQTRARLARSEQQPTPSSPNSASETAATAPDAGEALLRRDGDYWTLRHAGLELRLKHSRGIDQLATLLASPGEPHWALVLAADVDSEEGRAASFGDGGELLDATARRAYEARARELEEELNEARHNADIDRVERVRAEMDALAQQLSLAFGLGGRARRATGGAERARQSVTKAVRGAIRRIAELSPPLGEQLERSVRTGISCVFDPDPNSQPRWRVERLASHA